MFDVGGVLGKLGGSTAAKVVDRGACGENDGMKLVLRVSKGELRAQSIYLSRGRVLISLQTAVSKPAISRYGLSMDCGTPASISLVLIG